MIQRYNIHMSGNNSAMRFRTHGVQKKRIFPEEINCFFVSGAGWDWKIWKINFRSKEILQRFTKLCAPYAEYI